MGTSRLALAHVNALPKRLIEWATCDLLQAAAACDEDAKEHRLEPAYEMVKQVTD